MLPRCPKCKSKNLKCIHTEIDSIQCECLDCKHEFNREPTRKEIDDFND